MISAARFISLARRVQPRPRRTILSVLLMCLCLQGAGGALGGALQLGIGAHYWRALDSLDSDQFDQSGTIWLLSGRYQVLPGLGIGLDLEQFPKGFAGSPDALYAPAVFLLVGRGLYAGLGTGRYLTDAGRYSQGWFYVMRGGVMFSLLPSVILDLYLNYRYDTWDSLSATARDVDTDTLTLGTALRIAF